MDFSYPNSYNSNNNYSINNNSLGRNSVQDDYLSEEFTKTERSDSEKVSFMADKSQPKVSISSLINHEIVRSNRITTLMNAVSNSSQYPVLGNKKSHTFLSTHPLSKASIKSQKQISLDMDSIADSTTANIDETTSNDIVNANTVNTSEIAGINLLKQIEQHHPKQNITKTKTKHITNKQSISDNHIRNNINSISNKEVEEEISNNNSNHLTVAVLKLLNQLEIKFPGKTNEQTKSLLQKVILYLGILLL